MSDSADGTLAGVWFDGDTSRARAVVLALETPDRLRLATQDGVETWPLSEVSISPRLGATPRILRRDGHGQVECADDPLLGAWGIASASRVDAMADWLERRRLAIAGAALAVLVGTVGFVQWGVPWVAEEVAERMPSAVERAVSHQALELLEKTGFHASKVPAARRKALQDAFVRLVDGEPRADQMRLRFVDAPALGPNAFALPDGRIYMTDELVALAADDDGLLAVLAHEAGHHVHRHGMRGAIESSSVFLGAGLLFGDVSGSSVAVAVPVVLLSRGFSRGHEREADAYAFGLLARRGRSPGDFAEMMERLAASRPDGMEQGGMGYLSTHPPSPERIAAARRAAEVPPRGADAL